MNSLMWKNSCLALALTGLKKHITSLFRAQKYNQKTSHNKNVLNYKYANGAIHSWAFGVVRAPAQHGVSMGFSYARCALWIPAHSHHHICLLSKKVQEAFSSLCLFFLFFSSNWEEGNGWNTTLSCCLDLLISFFWQE